MKRHYSIVLAFLFSLLPLFGTPVIPASAGQQAAQPVRVMGGERLQPVKVLSRWTQTSRTYRVGDHYVAHLYTTPVNYWAHGAWHSIDTSLVPSRRSGAAYQTKANSYRASFPADLGKGMIRIQSASGWLAFGLAGVHARPAISSNRAVYALPGARITYTAGVSFLKEAIALTGPSSPSQFHYRLQISAELAAHQLGTGGISFTDRTGRVLFSFAPPTMRDAAGSTSRAVSLQLHGSHLTLSASTSWLHNAHRAYPVVVDPTTLVLNPSQSCTLNQAAPTTASCNTTGTLSNVTSAHKNILFQFNLASIPSNSEVLDANLGLDVTAATGVAPFTVNAYQVTHSWTTAATWNTYDGVHAWTTPGGDTTGVVMGQNTTVYSSGAGWYYFQPVQLVQDWVNGITANDGVEFKVISPASSLLTIAASPAPSLTVTYTPWLGGQPYWSFDEGVNVANGNLLLGEVDLAMDGVGLPLVVGRTYNSLNAAKVGVFGSGWLSNTAPDVSLTANSDGVVDFNGPTGIQAPFFLGAVDPSCRGLCSPNYTSPPGMDADLVNNGNGYVLTDHQSQGKFIFNTSGQLTADVDRSGNSLTYTYDVSNRLSTITDTQGRTTTFAYTSPVSSTLVSQITDPASRTYGYTYDSNKNLTAYTNPANGTTQYSYDASHNLTQIIDPKGNEIQYSYDSNHRVTAIKAVTDPSTGAGYTTGFTYNAGNSVVTDADGRTNTYTYDGRGRVTSFKDGKSNTWQKSWTSNNDTASLTTPSGNTTSLAYDANHNLTAVTLPAVNGTSMTSSCAYANTTWIYQPSSCTDEQGHTTSYGYDSAGRLNSVTDATNHSSSSTFNSNGTLASETDANGHTTTHTYYSSGTNVGFPQQDTPPSPLGTTQYTFNSANLQTSVTDGKGQTTNVVWDALGRVTSLAYHNADGTLYGTITYAYDADGNVISMTDGTGTTIYTYNSLSELTSKTLPSGPYLADGHSVDYTYDPVGNLASKQDSGGTVTYGYNANDQVNSVIDRGGRSYTIGYDTDGNQTSVLFPNGVTEMRSFNSVGQLSQINATTSAQQTLTSFSYSYINPATNQLTRTPYSITDTQGNATNYTYDASQELTQAVKKTSGGSTLATYGFGYDATGNITSKSVNGTSTAFTYNAANELTAASGALNMTYTYDANGDRTSLSDGSSVTINPIGQVASMTPPGGGLGHGGGTPISYSYTGVGEQERVGAGNVMYQYDRTGLSKQSDSLGGTYFTSLPNGALLSETVPNGTYAGTYYYLSDGSGNVAALMDSAGTVRDTYSYDPLGNMTVTGPVPNPFTFQSAIYDSATGYYYTGEGYYDPTTGQTFGCKDRGQKDTKAGEDFCGEDESEGRESFSNGKVLTSPYKRIRNVIGYGEATLTARPNGDGTVTLTLSVYVPGYTIRGLVYGLLETVPGSSQVTPVFPTPKMSMPKHAQYEHYTVTIGTFATHCKTVMFEVQPLTVASNTIIGGSTIAFHGPYPSATVPSSECDA